MGRFLYGGNNGNLGPEAVSYDEIYILTLPAFSWYVIAVLPLWSLPHFPTRGEQKCSDTSIRGVEHLIPRLPAQLNALLRLCCPGLSARREPYKTAAV